MPGYETGAEPQSDGGLWTNDPLRLDVSRPFFLVQKRGSQMYLKSRQVAKQLGINYWRLVYLLRSDKIAQPKKDASGDLIWTLRDVRNAQKALERR